MRGKKVLLDFFPSSLIISYCTIGKSKLVLEEAKDIRAEKREIFLSLLLMVIWVVWAGGRDGDCRRL